VYEKRVAIAEKLGDTKGVFERERGRECVRARARKCVRAFNENLGVLSVCV